MPGSTGHGLLSRVRSQRKQQKASTAEDLETLKPTTLRRQYSVPSRSPAAAAAASSTSKPAPRSYNPGHWPPIEFDPLKLNPPVHAPARLHERQPLQRLQTQRSFAAVETATQQQLRVARPRRLHHSDSALSVRKYQESRGFDFAQAEEAALRARERRYEQEQQLEYESEEEVEPEQKPETEEHHDAGSKGWPSPATSIESDKSWWDYSDDEDDEDEVFTPVDGDDIVETALPSPPRRPMVGSPDDPSYFMKRGEWKRRGIFFGLRSYEAPATPTTADGAF